MVKMKLKLARDKINYYLRLKNKDMEKIEAKINDKIPVFKENGDKKELLPLLRAKKEIMDMIEKGELRKQIV